MKIALIETALFWENPAANRKALTQLIDSAKDADLIVLPEMFTSGFTMSPKGIAEDMDGETLAWLKELSSKYDCAITGSIVIREGGRFFNRLLFVKPSGDVAHYDKRHLFTLAGENEAYTAGKERIVVEYKGFRICPLICYDLRFPVFARNTENYDILLFVANWPKPRINAWDILLKARAIENACYTFGANRIGEDSAGHEYPGHSRAIDFSGNEMQGSKAMNGVVVYEADRTKLDAWRRQFSFLDDRDYFTIR